MTPSDRVRFIPLIQSLEPQSHFESPLVSPITVPGPKKNRRIHVLVIFGYGRVLGYQKRKIEGGCSRNGGSSSGEILLNLSAASLEGAVLSVLMGLRGCGSVEVPDPKTKNEGSMPTPVSQM